MTLNYPHKCDYVTSVEQEVVHHRNSIIYMCVSLYDYVLMKMLLVMIMFAGGCISRARLPIDHL